MDVGISATHFLVSSLLFATIKRHFERIVMPLRIAMMIAVWLCITAFSAVASWSMYSVQRTEYIAGVDSKLLTAARMIEPILPPDYHSAIVNKSSVPARDYLKITQTYNDLCLELGLQYLWSVIVLDGEILFTTGTSTSKNVASGDFALFLDKHTNPAAFDAVLKSEDVSYSTFHNKWGEGRMVLIPRRDAHGRLYILGSSVQLDFLGAILRENAQRSLMYFLFAIAIGAVLSYLISAPLARKINEASKTAAGIAKGDYSGHIKTNGLITELSSLADSLNGMSIAVESNSKEILWARDEAEVASRAKSEFLANMSHELQTPLNGIIGMADLLRTDDLTSKQKQRLEIIFSTGHQLLGLLNDVLDLSKVEAGHLKIEAVETDARSAIELALSRWGQKFKDKGLQFSVDITPDDLTMTTDPDCFRQIVENLISNAWKFTPHGEVQVKIWSETDAGGDDFIHCSVADSGIGISEVIQPWLFDKFVQADTSIRREFGGTGLGLALCKQLTGALGGSISLDSTEGVGSTFTFCVKRYFDKPAQTAK